MMNYKTAPAVSTMPLFVIAKPSTTATQITIQIRAN
jgi:hypothetical protein